MAVSVGSRAGVGLVWTLGIAAVLAAIAIVVAVATSGAPGATPSAELAPRRPAYVPMRVPATIVQRRADSGDALPAWFGRPDLPARRIAGQLRRDRDGSPVAGTIHLRIDAPDATIWRGVDIDTGPDGWFDFGEVRAGRYDLLAVTPGETSRAVLVDTRERPADTVSAELVPCTEVTTRVHDLAGAPIAGAQVDLAGVVIATTGRDGGVTACFMPESAKPVVRAVGYAVDTLTPDRHEIRLAPTIWLRGHVTDADGKPAAGVAVEPVASRVEHRTHVGDITFLTPLPVQAVTAADGSFLVHGVRAAEGAGYGLRVLSHDLEIDDPRAVIGSSEVSVSMAPPPPRPAPDRFRDQTARISGQVLRDGRAVAGAEVWVVVVNYGGSITHTAADGSFVLDVPVLESEPDRIMVSDDESSMDTALDLRVGQRLTDLTFDLGR